MKARTPERNDELRRMNDRRSAELCAHFGITRAALSMWRKALGLAAPAYAKSPEHVAKIAARLTGRSPSAETRERLSAAIRGRKRDPDAVARMVARRIASNQERAMANVEWTAELIARLRTLWDEGHFAAQIGVRLRLTKNAVIGKAHRLGLPERPSPIRPSATPRQPRAPRSGTITLKPLAIVPHVTNGRVKHTLPVEPVVKVRVAPPTRFGSCCYPIGEPATASFRFCGAVNVVQGKPYCPEHCSIAYVRIARPEAVDAA